MSLRVDEEILREWREQVASGFEPGATMRLAPTTPVGEALSALDAVVGEVVGSPPPLEGPSRGEWSWIRAVDDVVVTVRDCDVLPDVLPAVVAGLEARGVGGVLHAHAPPVAAAELPAPVRMLEARLR
ncbi:MAG: hypothetical protein M3389_00335, partial [Actinomycetota bacterium]|nr:hypothetical protein [Actinomycetota bacterium]